LSPTDYSVALEAIAASADRSSALQSLTDQFGRVAGASAVVLAVGGWNGTPVNSNWRYDVPGALRADTRETLQELIDRLREPSPGALEAISDVVWRTKHETGMTSDFIAIRVRAGGVPLAALCAAVEEASMPPGQLIDVARDFAALAALCLIGGELGGRPRQGARNPLAISLDERELRAALGAEITRCAVSGEPLTLCIVDIARLAEITEDNGDGSASRLLALLGQVVAEAGQPYDLVGRVDSSGLVVVIPGADRDDALATTRHLTRVTRLALGTRGERDVQGAFRILEWDGREDVEDLLARARSGAEDDGGAYDRPS
jgi:GGDEF domain-containing protein